MPKTIEAEIIEIDGVVPPRAAKNEEESESHTTGPGAGMRGAILNLDRRWWPLWVLLGVVVVVLVATVGVVAGACYVIFSLIRGFLRSIFGVSPGRGSGSGALRRG